MTPAALGREGPSAFHRLLSAAALAAVAVLAVLAAQGCASRPRSGGADVRRAPSYADLKGEELRELSRVDPARAIEAIAYLASASRPSGPAAGVEGIDLASIAESALASVESAYEEALGAEDFRGALARLADLEASAADPFLAASMSDAARAAAGRASAIRSDILAREAASFYGRRMAAPALRLYIQALEDAGKGSRDGAEVAEWTRRAVAARDRGATRRLVEYSATRGIPSPEGAAALISSRDSIAEMRKGVATIRVDRGIKIEQGVGSPDRGLGSGFFIDASGYMLTNYHVISSEVDPKYEGYSRLTVKLADSPDDRIPAKVVGWDRLLDIALLKVDVVPEYVFSLSGGELPDPGERVMAFGSPLGLSDTVTSGIVSAAGRRIVGIQTGDTIQVDVAINPGNSGGPLVDEAGDVVGVAFAGFSQYQGLNFAIPSGWVARILPALFRGGEVKRPWLGLAVSEGGPGSEGARLEVVYRHPSAAEGLEEGDRLVSIGGFSPSTIQEAQAALIDREPGSLVLVEKRGMTGTLRSIRCLGERPYAPFESAAKLDRKDRLFPALFGMSVRRLPSTLLEPDNFSISRVWPGTIADESGLSENDPISLRKFIVDSESRLAYIQIYVKKRKAGFLESVIQIPASLDSPDFL